MRKDDVSTPPTKITRKSCTTMTVVVISLILLVACTQPKPEKQFTLRAGVLSTLGILPYAVIKERGLDKQYGLTLVETPFSSGAPLVEGLANGVADLGIAISTVPILIAAENGIVPSKVVLIAAMAFTDPEHPYIGVLTSTSINTWKDLKGQLIGITGFNNPTEAAIKARLKIEGVSDYKLVDMPIANLGLSVAGGNIAACVLAEPYLTQSLLRKDGQLLGWVIGGVPFERMEISTVVASANLYRDNPQGVKAFLRAYLDALKWISQNPADANLILGKQLSLATEVIGKMAKPRWSQDGHNDPAMLESMQPVLMDAGMLKGVIPASKLYDETLLNEVLAEKR
jgi:ABC-type nitrate/sulfonate/bicarbonate transport system substrate-binding protein